MGLARAGGTGELGLDCLISRAAKSNQKDRQCLANKNKAILKLNPFLYKP
jgi:hypothetical protein